MLIADIQVSFTCSNWCFFPAQGSLCKQRACKACGVFLLLTERKAYIITVSPHVASARQACCLFFAVSSLISPLLRLFRQPLLASVHFMPWSHTWALGSWYTLKAMTHSRWKCFTLKQGHAEIMADSGAEDTDKDELQSGCFWAYRRPDVHGWWMR